MSFKKTLLVQENLVMRITEEILSQLIIVDDAIEYGYTFRFGGKLFEFTSSTRARVGDYLIRRPSDRIVLLEEHRYKEMFRDLKDNLDVVEYKDEIQVWFAPNVQERTRIMQMNLREGEWIVTFVEDITGYDAPSAMVVHTALHQGFAKMVEARLKGVGA